MGGYEIDGEGGLVKYVKSRHFVEKLEEQAWSQVMYSMEVPGLLSRNTHPSF